MKVFFKRRPGVRRFRSRAVWAIAVVPLFVAGMLVSVPG